MVKTYLRKTERGRWSEENMKNAVDAVVEGRMGYRVAAKTFFVPQTTLERKVNIVRKHLEENTVPPRSFKVSLGSKQQVFSDAEEQELCDYILDMESRLYGLTIADLRRLAYMLANKNNKPHPFNDEKQMAGKDWAQSFLKRHPSLSIRQPESTSAARAAGFNKQAVDQFFTFLGNVYDEHQLTPDRIYNCDETGISVVPKTKSKIIAKKGRKQVGSITSAERETTITVEICFSASGQYMPPMMIYPRKRMDPQLMLNAAPGAWGVCSDSGWMTTELFLQWFRKFVQFSGATPDRPVLLLLDGHSTHTQNIDLINEARSNGVVILCFPPHTTHRLQVADVAFMRPLSTYYDQQLTSWLRSNPGMVVTLRQVAEIFGKAFIQAATMQTAVNLFKKCGIWPYDPTVFSDSDFAPSLTTDIPQSAVTVTEPESRSQLTVGEEISPPQLDQLDGVTLPSIDATSNLTSNDDVRHSPFIIEATSTRTLLTVEPEIDQNKERNDFVVESSSIGLAGNPAETESVSITPTSSIVATPGCSFWPSNTEIEIRSSTPQQSIFSVASPQQILPLPVTRRTYRVTKKRGKTAVITSSPYKKNLEEVIKKKKLAEETKQKKKEQREAKKIEKTKKAKRVPKKVSKIRKSSTEESDSDVDNPPCVFCKGLYLDSNEGWAACGVCGKWAHCSCAGLIDEDDEAAFNCCTHI